MDTAYTAWAWPWWTVMVIINALNVGAATFLFRRSLGTKSDSDDAYRRNMRIMGLIFVLVGAYRSVFVSRYFAQMAWFDTIANSSLLIRTFAIAAELSFAGLIALGMLRVNSDLPSPRAPGNKFWLFLSTKSPYVLVGSIFVAQFFATSGLIMKSSTLFAIEETLWSVGFVAILPLAIAQLRRVSAASKVNDEAAGRLRMLLGFTRVNAAWAVIYCCYGLAYHLPLESWPAAFHQMQTGLPAIKTGLSAVVDAFTVVNESKAYSDWGFGFLLWHSSYFSICVWIAIYFMRAPRLLLPSVK
jgi:hypothetical protein